MKIESSSIQYASQHSAAASRVVQRQFHAQGESAASASSTQVQLSSSALEVQASSSTTGAAAATTSADPMLSLLQTLVEMLVGHKLKLMSLDLGASPAASAETSPPTLEFSAQAVQTEVEVSNFQAEGQIHTRDGKSIDFRLDVQMSRSFASAATIEAQAGAKKKDPLVINFGGNSAQLQSTRFAFDLTGDGTKANIALLGSGSAYLALDANNNGKVDSGKELFGTQSGNGFADLAKYDSDGNGWIDDNDPVFSKLQAWAPAAEGQGMLTNLKALGVGALYLGAQSTPFEIRDNSNRSLGAVRASGVYANEDGSVGSLQQVDLTV